MGLKISIPAAPKHLSKEARALWKSVIRQWRIDDDATLAILRVSLEAWDRAQSCRSRITEDGEVVKDRFGQDKPHPLLQHERDARSGFLGGMRQLGLDPEVY